MEFTEEKLFWYLAMLQNLKAQSKDSPLRCRSRASRMLPVPALQKGQVPMSTLEPRHLSGAAVTRQPCPWLRVPAPCLQLQSGCCRAFEGSTGPAKHWENCSHYNPQHRCSWFTVYEEQLVISDTFWGREICNFSHRIL